MLKTIRQKGFLVFAFLVAHAAVAQGWENVQRISPDEKVHVARRGGKDISARFVSASDAVLVVRSKSGEQSLARQDVRVVRVASSARRLRSGLIWTAAGAAAGLGIGFAICPGCANEGAGGKYTGPLAAAGAGLGAAVGFLKPAYRTVYKAR